MLICPVVETVLTATFQSVPTLNINDEPTGIKIQSVVTVELAVGPRATK